MTEVVFDPTARAASLRQEIAALSPWFHNLHMPDGTQTIPNHFLGGDFPTFKWRQVEPYLPARMDGWEVLDVGCNAGFYSFELARRGATVLGIDVEEHFLKQARWAAREFGLEQQVEFERLQVYELSRSSRSFDLVWFMGVFYHLRYPLLALDVLAERTRRLMVFQTLTVPGTSVYPDTQDHQVSDRIPLLESGWPKMAFIEHRFASDASNWWLPNHAGCEALLRSAGLEVVDRPGHELYVCAPSANAVERRALYDSQLRAVVAGMPPTDA